MAFDPIPAADIEVGKPVKKSILETTRTNFDDHETRIQAIAAGANKVIVFTTEIANLQQYSDSSGDINRIIMFKADVDFNITNAQVYVMHGGPNGDVAPTSGTLEIDVKKGTVLGSLSTVFNVKPAVTTFGDGDTNGTVSFISGGEVVTQGDWLQLDITNLQTGQTRIFVDIYGEPS